MLRRIDFYVEMCILRRKFQLEIYSRDIVLVFVRRELIVRHKNV